MSDDVKKIDFFTRKGPGSHFSHSLPTVPLGAGTAAAGRPTAEASDIRPLQSCRKRLELM